METPARRERAVGPVALEPEALGRLLARQPAQGGNGQIAAARGEEAENDVPEIARPDEPVAAGLLEGRVELRRGDRRTRLAVGQLFEDEEGASVQLAHGALFRGWSSERDRLAVVGHSLRREHVEADRCRPPKPRDRLVRRRAEGDEEERFVRKVARESAFHRRAVDDDVVGRLETVRLLQRRRCIDCDELDGKSDVAQVEDEGARAWIDVARAAPVVPVEAGRDPNDQPLGRGRADASSDDRLRRCHEVGDLHGGACDLGRRA